MKNNNIVKLVACIAVCEIAGAIGAIFTFPAIETWYAGLQKPSFSPPNTVFGPVWTILYLLMGVSLYLIIKKGIKARQEKEAVIIFGVQLGLNFLWSILFFGLKSPLFALADIALLWVAILATIIAFFRISKKAAFLLVPYLLWVSFALVLNFTILILNP